MSKGIRKSANPRIVTGLAKRNRFAQGVTPVDTNNDYLIDPSKVEKPPLWEKLKKVESGTVWHFSPRWGLRQIERYYSRRLTSYFAALKLLEEKTEGSTVSAITVNLSKKEYLRLKKHGSSVANAYGRKLKRRFESINPEPQMIVIMEQVKMNLHAHISIWHMESHIDLIKDYLLRDTDPGSSNALDIKTEYRLYRHQDPDSPNRWMNELEDELDMSSYPETDSFGRRYRMQPIDAGWLSYGTKQFGKRHGMLQRNWRRYYTSRGIQAPAKALYEIFKDD